MATFDSAGRDSVSFPPFILADMRAETGEIFMALPDEAYPDLSALNYPTAGHGIRGLIVAARVDKGLEAEPDGITYEAEFDQCYVIFDDEGDADTTAALISAAFSEQPELERLARLALAHDLF